MDINYKNIPLSQDTPGLNLQKRERFPISLGEKIPSYLHEWVFDKSRISKTKPECPDFFYMLFLTAAEHDEWIERTNDVPEEELTEFNISFAKELYDRSDNE